MSTYDEGTLDYIKLLFRVDHDWFQDYILPSANGLLSLIDPVGLLKKTSNWTVLPSKVGEPSRYILEVWGQDADTFARIMPGSWFNNARRLDIRDVLPDLDAQTMRDAVRWLNHQEHKFNTALFDSKPRQKRGGNRDVGGVGIYFGSRKSGQHGVIYKRGNERPAIEYRVQDHVAHAIGASAAEQVSAIGGEDAFTNVMRQLRVSAWAFWGNRLGGEIVQSLNNAAKQGSMLSKVAQQLGIFDELPEERQFWNDLTTEQQADFAKHTWETTPKGSHESYIRERTDPALAGLDNDEDDLNV